MDSIIIPLLALLCYPAGVICLAASVNGKRPFRVFALGVLLMLAPLAILTLVQSQAF